jgi:glycosyltransferase involved in cell wall biosynthesis
MKVAILTTDSREHFRQYSRLKPYFGTSPQALLEGMARVPELEVHVLSCLQQDVPSLTKLAENIWYHGIHVPKLGWMRTLYQGCVRAVRRRLRDIQPDIVHGQGTERDCALSAIYSGFPNLITIHGNLRRLAKVSRSRPFSFHWLAARLERWVLPRAGGVICLSQHTRTEVQGLAQRTWIVPNAVDSSFFEVENRPSEPPFVLCVANVNSIKNQNGLIKALDPLAVPEGFRLVFVGGANPIDPYCSEFLALVKARPWCEHRGFANQEELKGLLASATLLVLPSFEENCPMAVLEGMAVGVPIAASDVGGVPDLLENGATGVLFDPRISESIAASVMRLWRDTNLARRLASCARQRAMKLFQPEVIARRHFEIYREVLKVLR